MRDAVQQALARRFPRAVLVDRDPAAAYVVFATTRGLHRIGFSVASGGAIALSEKAERMPASAMRPVGATSKGTSMSTIRRLRDAQDDQDREQALQSALEEAFPGHEVDVEVFDDAHVVFWLEAELHAASYEIDDRGKAVVSGPAWPVSNPKAARGATRERQLARLAAELKAIGAGIDRVAAVGPAPARAPAAMEPAVVSADNYAPVPAPAWGGWTAPRPHPALTPAGPGALRLHTLGDLGGADDFAAVPPDRFIKPAPGADQNPDFMPCPRPSWER